jgi:hypothetical protein
MNRKMAKYLITVGLIGVFGFFALSFLFGMTPIKQVRVENNTRKMVIEGNYLYLSKDDGSIEIVNIQDPENFQIVGQFQGNETLLQNAKTNNYQNSIVVENTNMYLANNRLAIYDISNATSPSCIGVFLEDLTTSDLLIKQNYLFLSDHKMGILVIDVSNPLSPVVVNQVNQSRGVHCMAISGEKLFYSTSERIYVLDITNPTAIKEVGSTLFELRGGYYTKMLIENELLYFRRSTQLEIYQIDTSSNLELMSKTEMNTNALENKMEISENKLLCISYNSLIQVDISDPTNPRIQTPLPQMEIGQNNYISTFAVKGEYIYTANYVSIEINKIQNDTPIWIFICFIMVGLSALLGISSSLSQKKKNLMQKGSSRAEVEKKISIGLFGDWLFLWGIWITLLNSGSQGAPIILFYGSPFIILNIVRIRKNMKNLNKPNIKSTKGWNLGLGIINSGVTFFIPTISNLFFTQINLYKIVPFIILILGILISLFGHLSTGKIIDEGYVNELDQGEQLLEKFIIIMKTNGTIEQSKVAKILSISENELSKKLMEWIEDFPFKIKGKMIKADNLSEFTNILDNKFDDWELKEKSKDGKIETNRRQVFPKEIKADNNQILQNKNIMETNQELINKRPIQINNIQGSVQKIDWGFIEFKKLMKKSRQIEFSDLTHLLNISEYDLMRNLLDWMEKLPLKFKGDIIIVDENSIINANLDDNFSEWKLNEQTKEGKVE